MIVWHRRIIERGGRPGLFRVQQTGDVPVRTHRKFEHSAAADDAEPRLPGGQPPAAAPLAQPPHPGRAQRLPEFNQVPGDVTIAQRRHPAQAAAGSRPLQPFAVDLRHGGGADAALLVPGHRFRPRHAHLHHSAQGLDCAADDPHPQVLLLGGEP